MDRKRLAAFVVVFLGAFVFMLFSLAHHEHRPPPQIVPLGIYGPASPDRAPDVPLIPLSIPEWAYAILQEPPPFIYEPPSAPPPVPTATVVVAAIARSRVPLAEPVELRVVPGPSPAVETRGEYSANIPSARFVSVESLRQAALAVGWTSTERLVRVALCESGVDSDGDGVKDAVDLLATGRAGERGPLQVHPTHAGTNGVIARMGYSWAQMYELGPNLVVGLEILRLSGWGAWGCA